MGLFCFLGVAGFVLVGWFLSSPPRDPVLFFQEKVREGKNIQSKFGLGKLPRSRLQPFTESNSTETRGFPVLVLTPRHLCTHTFLTPTCLTAVEEVLLSQG